MHGQVRRRAAAAAAAVALTVGLTVALAAPAGAGATTASVVDARPKRERPNLGVAAILAMPPQVRAGGQLGVKVLVVNEGEAAAPPSRVDVYLSRDPRLSKGDRLVGQSRAGRVPSWKSRPAPADIEIPASAHGDYYLIGCADAGREVRETRETDNCNGSGATMRVVRPLSGLLVGTLDLYDSGRSDSGTVVNTWDRYAQLQVTMKVRSDGDDIRVVDDGSGYSWVGEWTTTIDPGGGCPTVQREDEQQVQGLFQYGEHGPSKLLGASDDPALHALTLDATMTYDVSGSLSNCNGPVPYTDRLERYADLRLTEVARTDELITYRAVATASAGGAPSIWDSVEGTVELRLD